MLPVKAVSTKENTRYQNAPKSVIKYVFLFTNGLARNVSTLPTRFLVVELHVARWHKY